MVRALPLALALSTAWAARPWAERALERGIARFRGGDWAGAAVELAVAARASGVDPAAHLYLGYSRYKLGQHARAAASIRRALHADPTLDGPLPRFYLGLSLYRRRLYLGAREELRRVTQLAGRGKLWERARRFAAAIDALLKAPRSDLAETYHGLGLEALSRNRAHEAADAFDEALRWIARERRPADKESLRRDALLYLAGALCIGGRYAEALARLERDPALPRSERLRLAHALALAGSGRLAAARALLDPIARSTRAALRTAARALLAVLPGGRPR